MGAAPAQKVNAQLSDGRPIRSLPGIFNQVETFGLHKSGRFVPANEGIMTVRDLDDALNASDSWKSIRNERGWWRSGEVAFYRRGFETDLRLQIGKKLFYVESEVDQSGNKTGNVIAVSFNGPEETARLIGMGVIPLSKLSLRLTDEVPLSAESLGTVLGSKPPKGKEGKLFLYELSLTTDFNPATDVSIVDVMRPREWGLVDANGYPLRIRPSNSGVAGARYSYVRNSDEFEVRLLSLPELASIGIKPEMLAYIGSVGRDDDDFGYGRDVYADYGWSDGSGVALVGREATAPVEAGAPVELRLTRESPTRLIIDGTPEGVDAVARLVEGLKH